MKTPKIWALVPNLGEVVVLTFKTPNHKPPVRHLPQLGAPFRFRLSPSGPRLEYPLRAHECAASPKAWPAGRF